jgi:hypothetical protein
MPGSQQLSVNRLNDEFPVGNEVVSTIGRRVRQGDMLVLRASLCPRNGFLQCLPKTLYRSSVQSQADQGAGEHLAAATERKQLPAPDAGQV